MYIYIYIYYLSIYVYVYRYIDLIFPYIYKYLIFPNSINTKQALSSKVKAAKVYPKQISNIT